MQDSEDANMGFTSVDEREREVEVSWRSEREVTCKTCHGLAMSCYGEDCVKDAAQAIGQRASL